MFNVIHVTARYFSRIESKKFSSLAFFKSNNKGLFRYSSRSKSNVLLKIVFEFFFAICCSRNFFLSRGSLGVWINFSASICTVCAFCGFFHGTFLLTFLLVYFPDIHPFFLLCIANNFFVIFFCFFLSPFQTCFQFSLFSLFYFSLMHQAFFIFVNKYFFFF